MDADARVERAIAETDWTVGQSDRFVDCLACDDEIQRMGRQHIEAGQEPECWIWFAHEARPLLRAYAGNLELWLVSRRGAVKAVDLPMTEGVCAMLCEAMTPARPPVDLEDLPF
jgi:hypothetical protein